MSQERDQGRGPAEADDEEDLRRRPGHVVAHDLNNMLAVISGYASLLQPRLDADLMSQRALERILQSVERARALVAHLAARLPPEPDPPR